MTILTLHRFKIDQQNKLESDDLQVGNYVTDPRIFGEKNKILNELNGKNIMSTTIVSTTINFRKLSVPWGRAWRMCENNRRWHPIWLVGLHLILLSSSQITLELGNIICLKPDDLVISIKLKVSIPFPFLSWDWGQGPYICDFCFDNTFQTHPITITITVRNSYGDWYYLRPCQSLFSSLGTGRMPLLEMLSRQWI